jgi:ribosomal protein L12E/L44/L45/RPP1/RPP2
LPDARTCTRAVSTPPSFAADDDDDDDDDEEEDDDDEEEEDDDDDDGEVERVGAAGRSFSPRTMGEKERSRLTAVRAGDRSQVEGERGDARVEEEDEDEDEDEEDEEESRRGGGEGALVSRRSTPDVKACDAASMA